MRWRASLTALALEQAALGAASGAALGGLVKRRVVHVVVHGVREAVVRVRRALRRRALLRGRAGA